MSIVGHDRTPRFSAAHGPLVMGGCLRELILTKDDPPNNTKRHESRPQKSRLSRKAYNGLGMFAESEAEFLKAIALDPRRADFYNVLAINYYEWNKSDKAIEYYKKAIDIKPQHVLYLSLGSTYEKQGNLEEALKAYQKSVEIKPTFTHGLYSLASLHLKQGRAAEAIDLLRKVIEVEPTLAYAYHALGQAYVQVGDRTGAMQQYHILKSLNPNLAADLLSKIPK